jgi:hypothetical protein
MNGKSPKILTTPPFVLRFSKDERRVFQQNHFLNKGGDRKSPFVKGDLEGFSSAQHDFDGTLVAPPRRFVFSGVCYMLNHLSHFP